MLAVIGAAIVLGSVLGGYVLEEGHLMALYQPYELLIILGAAVGALVIATPMPVIKNMFSQIIGVFGASPSKKVYTDVLVMMYELFNVARKDGLVGLEAHIEKPKESAVLSKYSSFIKNQHAVDFLSDTMRLVIMGGVPEHDLDAMLDLDLETHHHENGKPGAALATLADSLPGLGIVAAVLGIVITMGAINGPAEEIGHLVGAALVGTFLGILLAYGFVSPLSTSLGHINEAQGKYFLCIKQGLLAFHKGFAASIAIEFARRAIPDGVRPGFIEVEEACRSAKAGK